MQIKEWIKNKQIQENEAAEIVATLPRAIRTPTKQVMAAFWVSLFFI